MPAGRGQPLPTMAGHCQSWRAMADLWPATASPGRRFLAMARASHGHKLVAIAGQSPAMASNCWPRLAIASHGRQVLAMAIANHGRPLLAMAGHSQPWPQTCGNRWPKPSHGQQLVAIYFVNLEPACGSQQNFAKKSGLLARFFATFCCSPLFCCTCPPKPKP